jgi:hypothetical protein
LWVLLGVVDTLVALMLNPLGLFLVLFLALLGLGVEALGVEALGVEALGVEALGVEALGVEALGVEALTGVFFLPSLLLRVPRTEATVLATIC